MQYKVIKIKNGIFSDGVKQSKIEKEINKYAESGWKVQTITVQRTWFRSCVLIVMYR